MQVELAAREKLDTQKSRTAMLFHDPSTTTKI